MLHLQWKSNCEEISLNNLHSWSAKSREFMMRFLSFESLGCKSSYELYNKCWLFFWWCSFFASGRACVNHFKEVPWKILCATLTENPHIEIQRWNSELSEVWVLSNSTLAEPAINRYFIFQFKHSCLCHMVPSGLICRENWWAILKLPTVLSDSVWNLELLDVCFVLFCFQQHAYIRANSYSWS